MNHRPWTLLLTAFDWLAKNVDKYDLAKAAEHVADLTLSHIQG
jgi:hypothetical protein